MCKAASSTNTTTDQTLVVCAEIGHAPGIVPSAALSSASRKQAGPLDAFGTSSTIRIAAGASTRPNGYLHAKGWGWIAPWTLYLDSCCWQGLKVIGIQQQHHLPCMCPRCTAQRHTKHLCLLCQPCTPSLQLAAARRGRKSQTVGRGPATQATALATWWILSREGGGWLARHLKSHHLSG